MEEILDGLNGDKVWIDAGAGGAIAIGDFHLRAAERGVPLDQTPRTIAIGIKKPPPELLVGDIRRPFSEDYFGQRLEKLDQMEKAGRHRYIEGAVEAIPPESLPRAAVITDLHGPLSYSRNPSKVLRWYLRVLETNGRLFIGVNRRLTKVRVYKKPAEMSWWDRFLLNRFGVVPTKTMSFVDWLEKRSTGLKIRPHGENDDLSSIEITRTGEPLDIPELELLKITDGRPPSRVFLDPNG